MALGFGAMMLPGCGLYTQTSFSEYRGPSEFTGYGGIVRTVAGIDVWTFGEPDRRFRVLGVIDQSYYNNGSLMSFIAGITNESAIITTAKKYGGDAIIFLASDSAITGYTTGYITRGRASGQLTGAYSGYSGGGTYGGTYSGNSSAYGMAHTHANTQTATRVAVIKYLD